MNWSDHTDALVWIPLKSSGPFGAGFGAGLYFYLVLSRAILCDVENEYNKLIINALIVTMQRGAGWFF